jgi:DNA topoisomerase-6 subunit B
MADRKKVSVGAASARGQSRGRRKAPRGGKGRNDVAGPTGRSSAKRKRSEPRPSTARGAKAAKRPRKAGEPGGVAGAGARKSAAAGRGRKKAATRAAVAKAPKPRTAATAADMAKKQRDISVSEFFAKNRHLLGFDNPSKAVKEGVDNSLDACEEAGILPNVVVEIRQVSETRFRVAIEDNGPGIVKAQVPKIFGSLLYGSKFHRLRQSRGQQGIGISAAGMYGLLTTGKPVIITTRTGPKKKAHHFELVIDTKRNEPKVKVDQEVDWARGQGTRVEIELEGAYRGGQHSVDAYIRQISLANPHAQITYVPPKAEEHGESHVFPRVTKDLPEETAEIKPHPYGVELGVLMQMFRDTRTSAACRRAPRRPSARRRACPPNDGRATSTATRPRRSTRRSRRPASWRRPRTASPPSARI